MMFQSDQYTVKTRAARFLAMLLIPITVSTARAQTIAADPAYRISTSNRNVAGGVSHLPDGDLLAFTSDFVNGPSLVRIDANGDGIPAGGTQVLAQFDSNTFPDFVRVAPGGSFALAGVSGAANTVYRVDLKSGAVQPYFDAPGNYDLAFIDDAKAYLSSNPGLFDSTQPNVISLVDLSATPMLHAVATISSTPSGPLALNTVGDLYYVKSTFTFPPPPLSSRLLRFSASDLAKALDNATPLTEANSAIDVGLEGGFNLAFHNAGAAGGELYLTTFGPSLIRVAERTLTPEKFLTVTAPADAALTFLSFFQPNGAFDLSAPSSSAIAVSLATNAFQTNSLIEIRPLRFFGLALVPAAAQAAGGKGTLTVTLERVADPSVRYLVTIKGPNGRSRSKSKTASTNVVVFTKLKPGVYTVQYVVEKRIRRSYKSTKKSVLSAVTVS